MNILNKATVLVLNRNWQAINVRTPQDAFCQMATNVATALDIELGDNASPEGPSAEALRPVTWEEWLTLPIRPHDTAVQTVRGPLNDFYSSLSDEQKAQFEAIGPRRSA